MLRALHGKNVVCDISFLRASLYNATCCWRAVVYIWLQYYALDSYSSGCKVIKWQTNPPKHSVYWTYEATEDKLILIHVYASEGTVASMRFVT